ncbi:hypothetical protein [Clostridium sp.]|jgi:hypothetical protein|uniref:hypothetical protein n=1 Tax=Clostridium sp. TaxID=1506 RepID=UPI002582BE71|nr:hypothetical protein [Clostridium sp.]MDF2503295.1 hypothetical protein [Clostridium sp.]
MKKFSKKLLVIPCIIIICIVGYFINYNATYSITDNKVDIQNALMKFINRPHGTVYTKNLQLEQAVNIDNKKYALFMNTNAIGNFKFLGDGELIKGRNNKYKVDSAGYAGQSTYLDNKIVKTDKGSYLIVYGENYNKRISYATVRLMNDRNYYVKIPNQEYFIAYCDVPKEFTTEFPYSKEMKLYDKDSKDITDEIYHAVDKINSRTVD